MLRKGRERNINTNTNPSSKATELPKSNRESEQNGHPPKDKNIDSEISLTKKEKPKESYEEKMLRVSDHYHNLKPEEKKLFALGALGLRGHGVPTPLMGSIAMKQLMVQWYDKTVENKSPQI